MTLEEVGRMSSTEYVKWIALHNVRVKEAEKARRTQEMKQGRF